MANTGPKETALSNFNIYITGGLSQTTVTCSSCIPTNEMYLQVKQHDSEPDRNEIEMGTLSKRKHLGGKNPKPPQMP